MARDEREERRSISDTMRKAFFTGLGALFMTEESVRKYVGEARLPRDIANYVLENARRGRDELLQSIARELSDLIARSDIPAQLREVLREHKLKVTAELELVPRDEEAGEPGAEGVEEAAFPDEAPEPEEEEEETPTEGAYRIELERDLGPPSPVPDPATEEEDATREEPPPEDVP